MNLEAFILGCGGMMPLPSRHLTSVLLRKDGDLFLFDCGEGTQVSLRRLNLRWKKISAIFISHTHADHVTGLPGILMLSSQVDRDEPLYIYGPPKVRDYVEANRKVLDMYINYEIIVHEFTGAETLHRGKDFSVRSFPLEHTKPCYGYTLEEDVRPGIFFPDKARELKVPVGPLWARLQEGGNVENTAGETITPDMVMGQPRRGRKFSYVTDSLYKKSIAPEVSGSDLLICEGMFEKELEESAREKKHMTSTQAATIARDAGGVKKMGLIHFSPRYGGRELKKLKDEARLIFPETFLTKDRMVIDIPHQDEEA